MQHKPQLPPLDENEAGPSNFAPEDNHQLMDIDPDVFHTQIEPSDVRKRHTYTSKSSVVFLIDYYLTQWILIRLIILRLKVPSCEIGYHSVQNISRFFLNSRPHLLKIAALTACRLVQFGDARIVKGVHSIVVVALLWCTPDLPFIASKFGGEHTLPLPLCGTPGTLYILVMGA